MPHRPGHKLSDFQKAQQDPNLSERLSCEAKGGKWDPVALKCILPTSEVKPSTALETFTDPRTGRASGITLPDGRTFLGLSSEDVERIAAGEQARVSRPEGTAPVGTSQAAADVEQAQLELQTTGAPVRRELDPTLEPGETTPVIGPLKIKIRKAASGFLKDTAFRNFVEKFNPREQDAFFELQPQELATAALTQIEKNEIEKGLTNSEKFGSFIESLGLGGLTNFAAEKPSENVQTILRRVKTAKTRATNAEIKVKDGTWRQAYGEEVIDGIELEIQAMESRIKLLLQDSPEFKFDSDGVNFIEDKIFEARERLFSAKINMISGAAKDPSEIQILIALQESIQAEDFEL